MTTEITLRKADNLFKTALAAAQKLLNNGHVSISIYDKTPVQTLIDAGRKKALDALNDAVALQHAAFSARNRAGEAMAESGINALLRERKQLDIEETSITVVLGERVNEIMVEPAPAERITAQIEAMAERLKKVERNIYGHAEDTVTVDVLSMANITELKNRLTQIRLRKRNMDEDLLSRNMRKIVLPDDVVDIFKKHGLM